MRIFFLILVVASITIPSVYGRPVSYPEGWTTIINNNGDAHSALVHYSPTAKTSIGLRNEYRRVAEYTITAIQINHLLKRWNKKNSQANLYLKSAAGMAMSHGGMLGEETELALLTGFAFDWETRRYFLSYENRYLNTDDFEDMFMQLTRAGVAPYIADFGGLHTWLMLEVEHEPEGEHSISVTPLVRLFKGVHLVEAGVSNHNDVMFNWTVRF